MISGKKKRSFCCSMGVAGILVVLLIIPLLSCPNPIDKMLANQMEDNTSPLITITSPDPDVKYYYPSEIEIEGSVLDFVDQAGGTRGTVQSLHYEEQFNKRIQGEIDFNSDGTFSFTIDTLRPEQLDGTQYLVITAVDWNGNTSEVIFTAYDKKIGPLIVVDIDYNMYTSSPAANVPFTITGVVEVPTDLLTYDVETDSLPENITGVDINYDGTTGDFSFDFNPSGEGVSGELKFILKANNFYGPSSYIFYLDDDHVPPSFDVSSAASGNNSYVDLFFSEGIYHTGGTAPEDADFTITGWNPGSGTVTDIIKSGVAGTPAEGTTTIRMNIDVTGVPYGDETLTVTASSITDEVGNSILPVDITLPLSDNTAPNIEDVRVATGEEGKAYKKDDQIHIIITFDGPVNWIPLTMDLNTGSTATCPSGGPSNEITLTYTVQDGDNTPAGPPPLPLNYTGISSLHGTVTDEGGNPVVDPVLPATPNDLDAMNITIDTIPPTGLSLVINDADGKISKQENKDGVPFEVHGEAFTDYLIVLDRCQIENPGTSPSLDGQIPVGGSITGFELETAAGVVDGEFVTVSVTLTDTAGNESTTSASLEVATVAPSLPVFDTSAHSTQNPSLYWNWHSGGGGNGYYRWKINDPDLTSEQEWDISDYTYPAPSDGAYTLYVEERNDLDNWSDTASQTITLDRGDPVVTAPASITVAAENANGTPKTSTAIDNFLSGATVWDAIDPSPALDVTVGGGTPPATFPVGVTTVTFTGTDDAGNTQVVNRTVTIEPTVISPDGGETWEAGTTHAVTWAHNDADNVKIDLYKGGVWNSEIIASTVDDGSYSWNIPSDQAAGTDYRVRVTDLATSGYDESDASFTITRITVSSPDGGETWGAGTTHDVTWINGTSNVDIDLYKGGVHNLDIATNTSNDGSYTWNIPSDQAAGTDYRVRVTDGDTGAYDESDAFFTIEKITVSAPDGSESWAADTQHDVTWTSSGSGSVKIELYKGGSLDSEITASTANSGSYPWTIDSGQAAGTDYRMRVTDLATSAYDESDADFEITNP